MVADIEFSRRRRLSGLLGLLLFTASASTLAVTVHTWIDADGVRHYADAPPPEPNLAAVQIELADSPVVADDYYSIVNQWQRLRAERESDAALALERERLAAERQAAAPSPPVYLNNDTSYPLGYFPYAYGYRHHRHGHGHGGLGPEPHFPGDTVAPMSGASRNANVNAPVPVWPRQRSTRN